MLQELPQGLLVCRIQLLSLVAVLQSLYQITLHRRSCDGLKAAQRRHSLIVRAEVEIIPYRGRRTAKAARLVGVVRINWQEKSQCRAPVTGLYQIIVYDAESRG